MIRTAIPFGYLFIYFGLFVGFSFGLAMVVWGVHGKSKSAAIFGAWIALGIAAFLIADCVMEARTEWAPHISGNGEIIGAYGQPDDGVELNADATFVRTIGRQTFS